MRDPFPVNALHLNYVENEIFEKNQSSNRSVGQEATRNFTETRSGQLFWP